MQNVLVYQIWDLTRSMEAREPLLMKLNAQKIDWPIVFLVSSFWGNGLVSMNYGIWFWNYFLRSKIITYSLIIIWKLIWWILKYEKLTINSHLNILLNCCYNLLLSFTTSKNTQSSEKTPSYRYCYVRN